MAQDLSAKYLPKRVAERRLHNRLAARMAVLGNAPRQFSYHLEPRAIGSYAAGEHLISGIFLFAGQQVERRGRSIWSIIAPSADFADEVQGFGWLDDLAAVGDAPARKLAQNWLFEWIAKWGNGRGPGWQPELAGRRLIRWCSHAMFILKGLEPAQSRTFYRVLGRQVRYLRRRWPSTLPGEQRFEALTGLLYAGVSLDGYEALAAPISAAIGRECERIIGEDGGLPSRNPEALMESYILLIWAARALVETGRMVDARHDAALDRMAPTLRGLRLGDGTMARFHGGRRGAPEHLDQAFSDARPRAAARNSNLMGFERLSAGRLTMVVDCAPPPEGRFSVDSHASTLAFELSSGRQPMLMSCGVGGRFGAHWRRACRATSAHNTVVIERLSSSRFAEDGSGTLIAGPSKVTVNRAQDSSGTALMASHNGYAAQFGLIHERGLYMTSDGRELRGEDSLYEIDKRHKPTVSETSATTPNPGISFAAQFLIHPDVRPSMEPDGQSVSLTLKNDEVWMFRQLGGLLQLEESVFLDQRFLKPRITQKIVVMSRVLNFEGHIEWSLKRA